jgi:large subunit ribosomal protein L30
MSATGKAKRSQAPKGAAGRTLKVTLVKGVGSTREDHRATVRGLGLKRIRHTVELEDTPAIRGMINKVSYLVAIVGE